MVSIVLISNLQRILADLAAKLSPATLQHAERMVDALYNELSAYYGQVFRAENVVQRVSNLMKLLMTVEVNKPLFSDLYEYL